MLNILKKFEHVLIKILILFLSVVLVFSTAELGWIIVKDITSPPFLHITIAGLMEIFGLFMVILIGLELLESVKAYLEENVFHIEVIMTVAMIAIARKVIVLDTKNIDFMMMLGIGIIILSLSVSYYLIVHSRGREAKSRKAKGDS